MIGYLKGKATRCSEQEILLLTDSGVGYCVRYSYDVDVEQLLEVFIYHHITDSDQKLWGFRTQVEKKLFELLLKVNKVGPSKAYPLITCLGTESLAQAIVLEKDSILSSVPGIGKKMAEQIILTLKDQVNKFDNILSAGNATSFKDELVNNSSQSKVIDEATLALSSLGYKEKDFMPIIRSSANNNMNSEQMIKFVLREL